MLFIDKSNHHPTKTIRHILAPVIIPSAVSTPNPRRHLKSYAQRDQLIVSQIVVLRIFTKRKELVQGFASYIKRAEINPALHN